MFDEPENIAQKCSEGNTITSEHKDDPKNGKKNSKRYRSFPSFVSFLEEEPFYDDKLIKYLVYGKEICPTTNKEHWQGAVYFKNPVSIKQAQKILKIGNSHMETVQKSNNIEDAYNYCKKDGKFKEFGSIPKQGKRTDLDEVKNEIVSGLVTVDDIAIENPMMFHQYGRTLERIEDIVMRQK